MSRWCCLVPIGYMFLAFIRALMASQLWLRNLLLHTFSSAEMHTLSSAEMHRCCSYSQTARWLSCVRKLTLGRLLSGVWSFAEEHLPDLSGFVQQPHQWWRSRGMQLASACWCGTFAMHVEAILSLLMRHLSNAFTQASLTLLMQSMHSEAMLGLHTQ